MSWTGVRSFFFFFTLFNTSGIEKQAVKQLDSFITVLILHCETRASVSVWFSECSLTF